MLKAENVVTSSVKDVMMSTIEPKPCSTDFEQEKETRRNKDQVVYTPTTELRKFYKDKGCRILQEGMKIFGNIPVREDSLLGISSSQLNCIRR